MFKIKIIFHKICRVRETPDEMNVKSTNTSNGLHIHSRKHAQPTFQSALPPSVVAVIGNFKYITHARKGMGELG